MPVVDKYRPVNPTPRTRTAPGAVLAGAWALALMVALASPSTLQAEATYGGWSQPITRVLRSTASLARIGPFAGLREALDGIVDPWDRTTRWFRLPVDTPEADGGVPVAPPPPTDTRTPGERWAATRPEPIRRVLIVGASSIQYAIGTELERLMDERLDVDTRRKGKVSTGLTRPDVFDWPAEVERLVAEFRPDLVIGQFGGNDGQNIVDEQGGIHEVYTEGWAEEYTRRITRLEDIVEEGGSHLLLLGMPVMRSGRFTKKIRWLNDITRDAITAAGGDYLDTFALAADDGGAYRAEVVIDGRSGRMRMDDGIHFTRLGGQHMARALVPALVARYPFVKAAPVDPIDSDDTTPPRPARVVQRTVPAGAGRPETTMLAWVPEPVPDDGLPLVVLLHGAWDGPSSFVHHLDAELSELATEQQVVIAAPDGDPHGWWLDPAIGEGPRYATWLRDLAVPAAQTGLPIDPDAPRIVAGISMGGHGALSAALDRPDAWSAVASLSGVVDLRRAADVEHLVPRLGPIDTSPAAWASRSALSRLQRDPHALGDTRIWLGVGEQDRHHADNRVLHTTLEQAGVAHTWSPRDGGHSWDVWEAMLPSALRDLTRPPTPATVPRPEPELPTGPTIGVP